MTFSANMKTELARSSPDKKCCQLAEIAGFVRMAGTVKLSGNGRTDLLLATENGEIARLYMQRLENYFEIRPALAATPNPLQKQGTAYELLISSADNAEQILRETGILRVREGCNYFPNDISSDLIRAKCCKRAYLRGAFVGAGTISNPKKGYHLELICNSEALAGDFRRLINSLGFKAKIGRRKSNYFVYLKEGEQISDFMALLGAHTHVMAFENVRIVREMRNKTNRIINCESANLDKVVDSAARQMEQIRQIERHTGIDNLPDKLREIAYLRLDHPEATLAELGELADPPLAKSGVHHRLRKLGELAARLEKEEP